MDNTELSHFTVDEITKSLINEDDNDNDNEIIDNYGYEPIEEDNEKMKNVFIDNSFGNAEPNNKENYNEMNKENENKNENNNEDKMINFNENINNNNNEEKEDKKINNNQDENLNENIENNNNPDKTIFSKIAEDMYLKIIQNNKKIYNYEDFINDQYLAIYSDKINNCDNNQIIKNFLNRNKQYLIDKNTNKKTVEYRVDQLFNFNFKKYSPKQADKKIKHFNNKQIIYNNKKKKDIEELSKKLKEERLKDYLNNPKINKNNLNYLKKKVKYDFKKRSNNLFRNKSNNKNENIKNKKMSDKEINNLVNKLHNEGKEHKLKNSKSSDDFYKTKKIESYTNKSTNKMLFNNFIIQYQKEIKNIISISYSKNPIITFDNFKILLFHMHFINEDTEINLIKDIWKELTSFSPSNQKDSDLILIFFLCFNNLYKNDIEDLIKRTLKWIDFQKYNKLINKRKELEYKYKELRLNRNQYYIDLKNQKNKEYLEQKYSVEKDNNYSKSVDKFINIKRKKLSESYNLILEEKRNKLEELRDENEGKLLKDCTFIPKINKNYKPLNHSKSNNVILKKNLDKKEENENQSLNYYNSNLNEKIFNKHPIVNDYSYQQEIFRYKNARNLRNERNNILFNSNNYKSSDFSLHKDMVFHNEKKFYKDTFNKFNTVNKSMKKEPLISLEIQIRNKKDILNYYKNENVDKVVQKFVKKHNLTNESKRQIKEALEKRLELL